MWPQVGHLLSFFVVPQYIQVILVYWSTHHRCFSDIFLSRSSFLTSSMDIYLSSSSLCLFDSTSLANERMIHEEVVKGNSMGNIPCTIPAFMYSIPLSELIILNFPWAQYPWGLSVPFGWSRNILRNSFIFFSFRVLAQVHRKTRSKLPCIPTNKIYVLVWRTVYYPLPTWLFI